MSGAPTAKELAAVGMGHDPTSGEVIEDESTPKWFQDGRVHSIEELDWAGEKLAEYERAVAENRRLLGKAIERLSARTSRLNEPYMREIEKFRIAIEVYAQANRDSIVVGQRKSRTLPGGLTLRWTERTEGSYRWDQTKTPAERREALVAWAQGEQASRSEDFEPLVEPGPDVPNLEEIKKYAATIHIEGIRNVFVPPGLEYVPAGESLDISVKEEP